jgi:uncharacterized protein
MSVSPGLVDTNVLVYALDADAPQHLASRNLLHKGRNGATTLYVTSQILCEFYSIVTNARRVRRPQTAGGAMAAIDGLLTFLYVLPTPASSVEAWLALLRRFPVTGADAFDLQLAATMLANDLHCIYTFNTADFESFEELVVSAP